MITTAAIIAALLVAFWTVALVPVGIIVLAVGYAFWFRIAPRLANNSRS